MRCIFVKDSVGRWELPLFIFYAFLHVFYFYIISFRSDGSGVFCCFAVLRIICLQITAC